MANYPKSIEEEIRKLAYEKWEYRRDNELLYTTDEAGNLREINQLDDWTESENEVLGNLDLRK